MVWIFLVVQAIGLGIIAWCFKAEDRDVCAATSQVGSCFSLLLGIVLAPISVKLLIGLLIVLFRSRMNHTFASGQEAILSYIRNSFQALISLDSNNFDLVSRLTPKFLTSFLVHHAMHPRQEQQTDNVKYPNYSIIDIDAVEVM